MKRFLLAFVYALRGVVQGFAEERNLRIHFLAAAVVLITAWTQRLDPIAVSVLVLTVGFVIAMELMNSAMERAIDLTTSEIHPLARAAKDMAAGAVLVAAIAASGVGAILFYQVLHAIVYMGILAFMLVWILIVLSWTVKKRGE